MFDERKVCRLPGHLSWVQASILPCAGGTAWSALGGVRLCHDYRVNDFIQLNADNIPLTYFLYKYREQIDPDQQLAIYDEQSFSDDREDIRSFIQQLNIFDSSTIIHREPITPSVNRDLADEHNSIDAEKWSIIDKALKHKFGQTISFRRGKSIVTEANRSLKHFHKQTIIR